MFQKIRRALALKKALGQVQEIEEQAEMSTFGTLIKSKRFWINMAGLAATVGGILPPKYAAYALIVANLLTKVIDTLGTSPVTPCAPSEDDNPPPRVPYR